jgi:hypothetical protein
MKYLGVILNNIWRLHMETNKGKAFRTFIRMYSLFKSELLSANTKLTLHITPLLAPPQRGADNPLKLQFLQNKVLRTTSNFPMCPPVCDLHMTFKLKCAQDYITKLRR